MMLGLCISISALVGAAAAVVVMGGGKGGKEDG